jgi:hypothetical protein
LERFDGEEALDGGWDGITDGINLATVGGCASAMVVTLPCLEWPPRTEGGRAASALGMLRRFCMTGAGPRVGTAPKPELVRDIGRDWVQVFFVAGAYEAALTGDTGRCWRCPGMFPRIVGVPSRGAGALEAVDTTEVDFRLATLGLAAGAAGASLPSLA